mmetsp:Transcript_56866/g.112987  ORF Transcript_56866/g.112987 Transcript_56866/m.112987 type:complete len:283 (+) Transcript_56866:766-1614(+)
MIGFPEEWSCIYLAEVALALDHVHQHGFLYRDLKLENVLVMNDGHIKLGDFGLAAKVWKPHLEQVGTPSHMAPEVLKGESYDSTVDWWAAGIVFVEMVLGDSPFPKLGRDMGLEELIAYFESGMHLQVLQASLLKTTSANARTLVESLLRPSPRQRLCSLSSLQQHPLYTNFDFPALIELRIPGPLAPRVQLQLHRSSDSADDTGSHNDSRSQRRMSRRSRATSNREMSSASLSSEESDKYNSVSSQKVHHVEVLFSQLANFRTTIVQKAGKGVRSMAELEV